ncbi:MAG: phosphohistidine phosphatase SixA [Acidobacteriota bacterium]
MELYLIRHAAAEPVGEANEFLDERRRLTLEGRERMQQAARGLRALGVRFDLILTSPLFRAIETAEIIADALGIDRSRISQTPALLPGATAASLTNEIRKQSVESIALVGHQPDLGQTISRIVCGYPDAAIQLRKGSVCAITVTETAPAIRGTLSWLLTSKQLRLIAKE